MNKHLVWIAALAVALTGAACGSADGDSADVALAPASVLPAFARGAPTVVQEAYRFAVANPDALDHVPCYCGCVAMGHTSNRDCYIQQFRADGGVTFDDHAFG